MFHDESSCAHGGQTSWWLGELGGGGWPDSVGGCVKLDLKSVCRAGMRGGSCK